MGTVIVGISDCRVSGDPSDVIATYALGSCVGVAAYDPEKRVGGILHVLLPSSRFRAHGGELNPYMYADTGVRAFLALLTAKGATAGRLQVKLAGGANMLRGSSLLDIGRQNTEQVLSLLQAEGIPVANQSVGGTVGRSLSLRIQDGQVSARLIGRGEDIL